MTRARERRHDSQGGRQSWKTFDAEAPLQPGFRALEGLREDHLAPGASSTIQPPRDVEILTYVCEGALIQEDASEGRVVLEAGECRRSSAPSGSLHRAVNGSPADLARYVQCFFPAEGNGSRLRSVKRRFSLAERKGILRLIAAPDGKDEALRLNRDARVYSSLLETGHHLIHELGAGRGAWLQVIRGRVQLFDDLLQAGDGASLIDVPAVSLTAREPSEILLFDLA